MPLQSARDFHVDRMLSNLVVGRRPTGYIADQLLPILNVGKQSDLYWKRNYLESIAWTPDLTAMAPGAKPNKVHWTVSSDTFYAKKYGLGTDWTTEDEVNADEALAFDRESAEFVTDRLLIDYEMRVAALTSDSSNVYTTTNVATAWSNTTGSRIFDDLADQIEAFRVANTLRPNVLVIPEQIATYVRRNDQLRDLLFGDRGGLATEQQLAGLLKIKKVLVPEIQVNTADPVETFNGSGSISDAWPNAVLLAHISPFPGRRVDTWAQGFRWTNPQLGVPFAIRRHPYDTKRMTQDIDAIYYQDEKIVSSELMWRVDSVI